MFVIIFLGFNQPDLTAIHTYFTRWLIRTNLYDLTRTNSYDFCQMYVFFKLHNSYEFVRMTYTKPRP